MDDLSAPFCACGASRQINWSPAFGQWLCPACRWTRTEQELRAPVTLLPRSAPEVA